MSENITEGTVGRLSSPKNVENIEKNIKNIRKQMRNFAEHKENMSNKDKEIENQKMSEIRDNFDKLLKKEIKELKIDDTEIINSNAFSEMMEKKLIQENKNDSITLSYTFTTKAIDPILNYYKILFPDLKNNVNFVVNYIKLDGSNDKIENIRNYWKQINTLLESDEKNIFIVLNIQKSPNEEDILIGHAGFDIIIDGNIYKFDTLGSDGVEVSYWGSNNSNNVEKINLDKNVVKHIFLTDKKIQNDYSSCITIALGTIKAFLKIIQNTCGKDTQNFNEYLSQFFEFCSDNELSNPKNLSGAKLLSVDVDSKHKIMPTSFFKYTQSISTIISPLKTALEEKYGKHNIEKKIFNSNLKGEIKKEEEKIIEIYKKITKCEKDWFKYTKIKGELKEINTRPIFQRIEELVRLNSIVENFPEFLREENKIPTITKLAQEMKDKSKMQKKTFLGTIISKKSSFKLKSSRGVGKGSRCFLKRYFHFILRKRSRADIIIDPFPSAKQADDVLKGNVILLIGFPFFSHKKISPPTESDNTVSLWGQKSNFFTTEGMSYNCLVVRKFFGRGVLWPLSVWHALKYWLFIFNFNPGNVLTSTKPLAQPQNNVELSIIKRDVIIQSLTQETIVLDFRLKVNSLFIADTIRSLLVKL